MLHKTNNRKEGFTIIEVLIVLAIAGLIMLIVFMAVPALQRNSRNTQRKNEVAALHGAVNEYINNANGAVPTTAAQRTAALQNAKLQFYTGQVTWGTPGANNTTKDTAVIVTGASCNPDGSTTASSARQIAVMYSVETGGNPQDVCQDA